MQLFLECLFFPAKLHGEVICGSWLWFKSICKDGTWKNISRSWSWPQKQRFDERSKQNSTLRPAGSTHLLNKQTFSLTLALAHNSRCSSECHPQLAEIRILLLFPISTAKRIGLSENTHPLMSWVESLVWNAGSKMIHTGGWGYAASGTKKWWFTNI